MPFSGGPLGVFVKALSLGYMHWELEKETGWDVLLDCLLFCYQNRALIVATGESVIKIKLLLKIEIIVIIK